MVFSKKANDSVLLTSLLGLALLAAPAGAEAGICDATTRQLDRSCEHEAREDMHVAIAVCLNDEESLSALGGCHLEALEEFREASEECRDITEARGELCSLPGFEGAYNPEVNPADFSSDIDNPFAPFHVGSHWVYEKDGEEGLEHIEIDVLDETREIQGVECRQVRDVVFVDGELVEHTIDYLAQHENGDVWYFGEIAQNFEEGFLVDLDGSWIAGEEGAKAGIWVKAAPVTGDFFRQEWLATEAEDIVDVIDTDAPDAVPFDNGMPILKTRDFTPLEADAVEFKLYVPGVGLVLEIEPESGEVLELIEFTP